MDRLEWALAIIAVACSLAAVVLMVVVFSGVFE